MSERRWPAGAHILYQEVWAEELLVARPMTVVADCDELLVLHSHPGAGTRSAALGSARYGMSLEERIAAFVSTGPRVYQERNSADAHVLVLAPEGRWSAVWLFLTPSFELVRWYVNLQQPIRRTSRGVEIRDCALDLVVQPNRAWQWKDRDEYEALCACGFFVPDVAAQVEAEAARMIGVIERWESPFRDGWETWRPDPTRSPPRLPKDWRTLGP